MAWAAAARYQPAPAAGARLASAPERGRAGRDPRGRDGGARHGRPGRWAISPAGNHPRRWRTSGRRAWLWGWPRWPPRRIATGASGLAGIGGRAAGDPPVCRSTGAEAFVEALTLLGITPPGTGWEAVLVHAVVPDACLPEFLRLVAAGFVAGGGGADADLPGTDPAVAVLLRSGGSAVTSFVEHCRSTLRLLDGSGPAVASRPADRRSVPATADPRRCRGRGGRTRARGRASAGVLRLEPFGRGVLAADRGDQTWRSVLPHEVADTLLVFDEDGEQAGRFCPPSRSGWLHPADRGSAVGRAAAGHGDQPLPLTWRGWRLAQLDLRGAPGSSWRSQPRRLAAQRCARPDEAGVRRTGRRSPA